MLDKAIKDQVKSVFGNLKNNYTFQVNVSDTHPSKDELINLLEDVALCSDKVNCEISEGDNLSFTIQKNGNPSNIVFKAVPNGHEFTYLLLAVLNLDGIGKNLPDELLIQRIKNLDKKIELKSYISLTCTNCPEVVQALNILSFLNPNITHEIIDGAINQDEVDKLNIHAVPTVYANGEQLHVGRSSLGELLEKIEKQIGAEFKVNTTSKKKYDVIVVGGGPAGVSSAIYSARKGFTVALIAEKIGGQVTETVSIENMISVPQTTGSELTGNLFKHLNDYSIDVLENRKVEDIDVIEGYKQVKTSLGEIEVDAHCRTNIPGIYAAGDVTTVPYKQIVVAMGEGSKATLSAFEDDMKGVQLGVANPLEFSAN